MAFRARSSKVWQDRTKTIREGYRHLCDKDSRYRCWYCGSNAETVDHSPAIEVVYAYGKSTIEGSGIELLLIPSCIECNSLLGDRPLFHPESRGYWLHEKLHFRYRKVLRGATFDKDELKEFGRNLRKYIGTQNDLKTWIERRLEFTGRFPVCEDALRELRGSDKKATEKQEPGKDTTILQCEMQDDGLGQESP